MKLKNEILIVALIILVGVGLRFATSAVFSGAYPPVDVYYVDKQAAQVILNLQNPYTYPYTVHNYILYNFAYLPMVPIYYAPFSLLGDIRLGNIFADILIMIASFSIAKSLNYKTAIYAPLAFALLPWSIWLTSVASTNFMVGTAFLMITFAFLLRQRFATSAIFLGLTVATNQFMILLLPLFGVYYWRKNAFSRFAVALAVAGTIILPFLFASPSQFVYDVAGFQFTRALQPDGPYSLFSVVTTNFGVQLDTWVRLALFAAPTFLIVFLCWRRLNLLIPSAAVILFLAAFLLPVNGLWNYFLPSMAIVCTLVPPILGDEVDKRLKNVKWLPHPF